MTLTDNKIKTKLAKNTILNFGKILFGIISARIKEITNKRFSVIVVKVFLIIKSLLIIFSIMCAWVSTPGITLPFGIFTKSNIPCAELPIIAILSLSLFALIFWFKTSTAEM